MFKIYSGLTLILASTLLFIDWPTSIMAILVFLLGCSLSSIFKDSSRRERRLILTLFQIVYTLGLLYICFCYLYMESKGYPYLLAPDVDNYFMPKTRSFIQMNDFQHAFTENWQYYKFFSRYHEGYFSYLIPFAYLSNYLGANLYVSMQISTLLIYGLSCAVIFKLFKVNGFSDENSFKNTLIIGVFSVLFFYSGLMLRDIHVMFTYLLAMYFTVKDDFSLTHLLKLIAVILVSCTLRIETGLFLFIMVPVYILNSMQASRNKSIAILFSFVIGCAGVVLFALFFNEVSVLLQSNSNAYLESDKGSGVVGSLQAIPIAGNLLSIVYNAIQPLPFWLKFDTGISDYRPEAYNIMTFPLSLASLFNWIVLCVLLVAMANGKIRKRVALAINKPFSYQLLIGLMFLYIQASVISQRRLMAYYVVFYILFFIVLETIKQRDKNLLLALSVISYSGLQVLAFFSKI